MEDDKNKDNQEPEVKDPEENKKDDNKDDELSYEKLTNEITKLREEKQRVEQELKDVKKAYTHLYERGSFHEEENKSKPPAKRKLSYDDIII